MTSSYLHDRLDAARRGLVRVHKALIDAEQVRYERTHGRIDSAGRLLQLVVNDPAFAWVRPLSSLIVRMDALLAEAEVLDAADVDALIEHARRLLRPDADGQEFPRLYHRALQESPDVVLAHGAALTRLESVH